MSVLVTGATGFIGRHLVNGLRREGVAVDILVRRESTRPLPEAWRDDVTCRVWDGSTNGLAAIVAAARPETVYHLASLFIAQHSPVDIEPLIRSNILFGTQLLEAMAAASVRHLVNLGSSWQHYQNQPYSPVCLYAATKQAFEAIMCFYVESGELRAVTLKLFDTYGSGDERPKLVPALIRASALGTLLEMSPGQQMVDFVHIDDVVEALLMAARRLAAGQGGEMDCHAVTSGRAVSLRQFVEIFSQATGRPLNVVWGGRPYRPREVMELWRDGAPLPGWTPRISLEEGLARTVTGDV